MSELTPDAKKELVETFKRLIATGSGLPQLVQFSRPIKAPGFDELVQAGLYEQAGHSRDKNKFRITDKGIAQARALTKHQSILENLKPLEKLILAAIQGAGDEWLQRTEITRLIGRPNGIQPNDIAALDKLVELGLIEAQQGKRGLVGVKWVYRGIKQ